MFKGQSKQAHEKVRQQRSADSMLLLRLCGQAASHPWFINNHNLLSAARVHSNTLSIRSKSGNKTTQPGRLETERMERLSKMAIQSPSTVTPARGERSKFPQRNRMPCLSSTCSRPSIKLKESHVRSCLYYW